MSSHKNFLGTPKKKNQRNTTSTIVFVNMWYWERKIIKRRKKLQVKKIHTLHATLYSVEDFTIPQDIII